MATQVSAHEREDNDAAATSQAADRRARRGRARPEPARLGCSILRLSRCDHVENARAQRGWRIVLRHGRAQHGGDLAEVLQLRRAVGALRGVLLDALGVARLGGVQRDAPAARSRNSSQRQRGAARPSPLAPQPRQLGRFAQLLQPQPHARLDGAQRRTEQVAISSWVMPL